MLTDSERREIDALVYDWLDDTDSPGASFAIVSADDQEYARGFGTRNVETNHPATPETLYGIASITKSFTALAVLLEVEAGRMELDAPITRYTDVGLPDADQLTIEKLLTHSTGLPNLGTSEVLLGRHADLGDTGVPLADREDLRQFLSGAGGERDEHSRGRFLYSNTAYTLLSHAIEATSGERFDAYVESEILDPLGMDRSTFDPGELADDENAAAAHRSAEDGFETTRFPARDLSRAAGGLISTPVELGRYLQFHLAGGELEGTRLLPESTLARAHEGHVEPPPRYGDGYGYGWMRRDVAGTTLVHHGGSLLTAASAAGFLPERDYGVALCCASQPDLHPTAILEGIVAIIEGADPESVVPELGYRARVEALTGEYESYRDIISATVTDDRGTLEMELRAGPVSETHTLVPEDSALDEWTFTVPRAGQPIPVEFVETDDGIDVFVDRYRLHQC